MTGHLIELYRKLRPLQIFKEHNSSSLQAAAASLTVMSYNLLAQHHINNEVYPYCVAGVLRASYRFSHLFAELKAYGPVDIVAFQEVSHFQETWKAELETKGQTETFYTQKEGGRDGLCIQYNSKRFTSLKEEVISFAPLMTALEGAIPNIAQILVLQCSSQPNSFFIVSNTHLFWRPEFDCLRVLQTHRLRKRIEEIRGEDDEKLSGALVIMCGDWNSDPKSAVYHLISGQIDQITRSHWTNLVSSHSTLLGFPPEYSQRLFAQVLEDFKKWPNLTSAYSQYQSPTDPEIRGEPPYTSINSYIDTLDYIFVDQKKMLVSELLMLPPDEVVRGQTALPNQIYSSDHLALWAKFHYNQ